MVLLQSSDHDLGLFLFLDLRSLGPTTVIAVKQIVHVGIDEVLRNVGRTWPAAKIVRAAGVSMSHHVGYYNSEAIAR